MFQGIKEKPFCTYQITVDFLTGKNQPAALVLPLKKSTYVCGMSTTTYGGTCPNSPEPGRPGDRLFYAQFWKEI